MKIMVIGGGLSGLATAALLAKKGHNVTLIEKNESVGGRASSFTKKGFTFDRGPSWYLMPEVFDRFFSYFDYSTADMYQLETLDPKYRVFSDTHQPHDVSADVEKAFAFFEKIESGSGQKLQSLLHKTNQIYKLSLPLLYKQLQNPKDLLSLDLVKSGFKILQQFNPFQSYHSFVAKHIKTPYLQHLLEFHTVFMGGSPSNTPALYSILIAADFLQQVHYPQGGITKIPEALQRLCMEQGVTIKTNCAVKSLTIENNAIKKVVTNYGDFEVDLVINTSDYSYFDTQIVPQTHRQYSQQYWDSKTYSISSLLLYIGVDKKIDALKHHNFYFQDNWNNHFNAIFKNKTLPQKPCFYICTPSKTDTSVAPKGKENLFILVPVGTDHADAGSKKYVDHVLQHIEQSIGEKFIDNIEYKQVFSQKDFTSTYNAFRGNALGLAHTLNQSVFLRPKMKSSKIDNLYHAGQFTQPGVGVPMTLISAELVTDLIEKNHGKKY